MLNFFKNLFGSGATDTQPASNSYAAAAPMAPVQVHARPAVTDQMNQPPRPATPRPAPRPVADGSGVQMPLYTIIAVLPLELKTRIRQSMVAEIFVTLPLDRVLTQLGNGSVKITFGELRDMAPNVFSVQADLDKTEISLPLNEILPQINPALLARRQTQKHIEVPEDLRGPFGNDFSGVVVADTRTTTMASTPAPIARETKMPPAPMPAPIQPRPAPPAQAARPTLPMPAKPTLPSQPIKLTLPTQPAKPALSPQAIKPALPMQPAKPTLPIQPARPTPPAPPAPTPAPAPLAESPLIPFRSSLSSTPTPRPPMATPPASPPVRQVLPAARGVGATPLPSTAPRLPSAPTNGNGHIPTPHVPQAAPAVPEVFLNASLASLSETWPEVLRSEIEQLNLLEAHLALPVRVVEPALKQGKIAFPWKVIRSWIRPATLPTVSAHDGMMLDLPLRVIAPLFIARQKQGAPVQQKVKVNEKIPNLFFGFPQGDSAAAVVEQPAPAPKPAPAPAPIALTPPPAAPMEELPDVIFSAKPKGGIPDTNFYVWGETGESPPTDESEVKKSSSIGTDFLTRYATPNEVVSRAAALEGVVGALVALPDGLMVASKLSADLNGDTLAAFLPHIFGKVSQCTKELRMGELNNLHFTVGNVPWKIFRVNAIFFAAFGHAGQPLPTAQLAALAGELDRKKQ